MLKVNDCTRSYADRISKMTELMAEGMLTEVLALRRACRTAWGACEEARIELYRHESDHGCDGVPPA